MLDLTAAHWATIEGVFFVVASLFLLVGRLVGLHRARCAACGQRALRSVQWIRAPVLVEGRRVPDSWSYFRCDCCGARYKRHFGRDLEVPSEAEWAQHCSPKA